MKRFVRFGVLAAAVGILAAVGPLSLASAKNGPKSDPKGNNGTVKIDGVAFDDAPNNEPHVGCSFQVDFYGYDQGDLNATVTFEGQAPTGGGTLLTDTIAIGEDAAGGGTDLDASRTYDLSAALANVTPQPNQGDHVKLTVNADGSQGSDVKHKVFWVSGCGGDQGGGGGGGGGGDGGGSGGGGDPGGSGGGSNPPPVAPPASPVPNDPNVTG